MIEGCSYGFNEFVDQELLDLIFSALDHTNRFVRETGYYVCSSLVGCGVKEKGVECKTSPGMTSPECDTPNCDGKSINLNISLTSNTACVL